MLPWGAGPPPARSPRFLTAAYAQRPVSPPKVQRFKFLAKVLECPHLPEFWSVLTYSICIEYLLYTPDTGERGAATTGKSLAAVRRGGLCLREFVWLH